jgi:hypothetical protein
MFLAQPTRLLFCWLLIWAFPALAGEAGRVVFVTGTVTLYTGDGSARPAKRGEPVYEGETIVAAPASLAQLRMVDQATIALKPDTRLRFDEYRYDPDKGSEKGFMSLVRGGFRTVTGAIGKIRRDNYQITTPLANIGIRGTDHEPMHIPEPAEGETPLGPPGTYDRVRSGQVVMRNPAGELVIHPQQVGFVSSVNVPPVLLPKIPPFLGGTSTPNTSPPPTEQILPDNTLPLPTPQITPSSPGAAHPY